MEEAQRRVRGVLMGGEKVLSDALRPIMDYLMKEIWAAQVSAEWHL